MNVQQFQDFMLGKGFKVTGELACGVEEKYPVSISLRNRMLLEVRFSVSTDNWKTYKKDLSRALKSVGASTLCDKNNLVVNINTNNVTFAERYQDAIQKTIEVLKEHNIPPVTQCAVCARDNCDTLMFYNGQYRPLHNQCCEQLVEKASHAVEKNDLKGNYFLGFIGAFLGAIVGAIPTILSIVFAEKIYAMLFALIPMAIYYGYKLFRGKLNTAALVITIVLSIVSVYFIEIILLVIAFVTEYGISVIDSIQLSMHALTNAKTWSIMTEDSISSFLFVILGIWISWSYISRTNKTFAQSVQSQIETKMSYSPSGSNMNMQP